MAQTDYQGIEAALRPLGLIPRGGFHPETDDDVPLLPGGRGVATLVLVGNAGPKLWRAFQGGKRGQHPLDAWCREHLTPLAERLGAAVLFPFEGPPHRPFLRWAQRAEGLSPSPIGPLIHPRFGLWHAYRGALLFGHEMPLPPPLATTPCDSCDDKPCLTGCPVAAFGQDGYDVSACIGYLKQPAGEECLQRSCQARRACPIGRDYQYPPAQAKFHMAAFFRNY